MTAARAFDRGRFVRNTLLWTLCVHFWVLLPAGLVLDGGEIFRLTAAACLVHWVGIAAILARRGNAPTEGDRRFADWGLAYAFLALMVAHVIFMFLRVR